MEIGRSFGRLFGAPPANTVPWFRSSRFASHGSLRLVRTIQSMLSTAPRKKLERDVLSVMTHVSVLWSICVVCAHTTKPKVQAQRNTLAMRRIVWKRVGLVLCLLGFVPMVFWEPARAIYYFTPLCMVTIFLALTNFPVLSRSMYAKPTWPEDLREDDRILDREARHKFENMFYTYSNVGYAVLFALILDWRFYRATQEEKDMNWLVVLGLIGGLFQLAGTARSYMAICIMIYVRRLRARERGDPENVVVPRTRHEMSRTELTRLVEGEFADYFLHSADVGRADDSRRDVGQGATEDGSRGDGAGGCVDD